MTIDSKYSRTTDFLNSAVVLIAPFRSLFLPHLQYRQKGFLGDLDAADALHALLAFLLLLEQLALAGNVAAVALGEHVLAHRPYRLACDDAAPDRRLDRHLEHLTRNQLAHLGGERAASRIRVVP